MIKDCETFKAFKPFKPFKTFKTFKTGKEIIIPDVNGGKNYLNIIIHYILWKY